MKWLDDSGRPAPYCSSCSMSMLDDKSKYKRYFCCQNRIQCGVTWEDGTFSWDGISMSNEEVDPNRCEFFMKYVVNRFKRYRKIW